MAIEQSKRRRRGSAIIYVTLWSGVLVLFVSLGVDMARVQLVKTQLRAAADAAARHGASGLSIGISDAQDRAVWVASMNKADGSPVTLDADRDIEFGVWDSATRQFTLLTGSDRRSATALRVTARRESARGNAVPLTFTRMAGLNAFDVTASAVVVRGRDRRYTISALACPWLAGMPAGTAFGGSGQPGFTTAPQNSPVQANAWPLAQGSRMSFRNTSGSTGDTSTGAIYGLDGDGTRMVQQSSVNGINSTRGPLNSLVGIYLDDRQPNTWAANAALDFSTGASRNFRTFSPQLKQVFFIGDGVSSDGYLQEFVVPTGATRLYLGVLDERGFWWDNTGSIETSVLDDRMSLVE